MEVLSNLYTNWVNYSNIPTAILKILFALFYGVIFGILVAFSLVMGFGLLITFKLINAYYSLIFFAVGGAYTYKLFHKSQIELTVEGSTPLGNQRGDNGQDDEEDSGLLGDDR